jgi:hypothetical protein
MKCFIPVLWDFAFSLGRFSVLCWFSLSRVPLPFAVANRVWAAFPSETSPPKPLRALPSLSRPALCYHRQRIILALPLCSSAIIILKETLLATFPIVSFTTDLTGTPGVPVFIPRTLFFRTLFSFDPPSNVSRLSVLTLPLIFCCFRTISLLPLFPLLHSWIPAMPPQLPSEDVRDVCLQ